MRTYISPYFLCIAFFFAEGLTLRAQSLADQVQIMRTSFGVPHIEAENLSAAAFGLAYAEMEDHGERVLLPLIRARGELAMLEGAAAIDADFINQLGYERTVATYHLLDQDTRDMYSGFAEGVNYYLDRYPDKFPVFRTWRFTGQDVAAVTTSVESPGAARQFLRRLERREAEGEGISSLNEDGSNAWALAPERTLSGHAILFRNPHLSWDAGYYEAHLRVPGKLNFYGDFRIGGLFAIIGGFNERLGWSTTNNSPDRDEVYAFKADPEKPDHYILDGIAVPISKRTIEVNFKNGSAVALERREFLTTPFGPVIRREGGYVYVWTVPGDGEFRRGDQFLRMMQAKNLEEWKSAMRMQAISTSNYTYADADGNIFYVWNALVPNIPHPPGGDTTAVFVEKTAEMWLQPIPFDELPQLHNPKGGYLRNENDPFHFTNLNEIMHPGDYPSHYPAPRLRQRSQLSLALIGGTDVLSLEEVIKRKHSMRMLLAEQVKPDLIKALQSGGNNREVRSAALHLSNWDNTVDKNSRGGVLFEAWWNHYRKMLGDQNLYAVPWSFEDPVATPRGLSDPQAAVKAFALALEELKEKYGTWDLAWGDVHRLRLGELDLPASGGPGGLGCFRVLAFREDVDGKRKISGGDGWQLVVEFSNPPKAYSVLAYGQSSMEDHPHHSDQASMFAESSMKPVAFTPEDIRANLLKAYRPGEE